MCETPSVFRAQARAAHKEYKCKECLRAIAIGELYEYAWGVWEGQAEAMRTCAECVEVREDLRSDLRASGGLYEEEIACELAFGNLREAIANDIRENR